MRNPVRCVDGNVIWTYDGDVLAIWRVTPPTTPRMPLADMKAWHSCVTGAIQSLASDSWILGITRPVSPDRVVQRMVAGVDLNAHPSYAASVKGYRDDLVSAHLTERSLYLVTKLPADRRRRTTMALASANAAVCRRFGINAAPPARADRDQAHDNARDILRPLRSLLGESHIGPIGEAEVRWIYARPLTRGTGWEPSIDDLAVGAGTLGAPSLVSLSEGVMLEGGDDTDADRPDHGRFVKITTEHTVSYQTCFTLATIPREWVFPHGRGACLSNLASLGYPLDWCVLWAPTANVDAQHSIDTEIRKLAGQVGEYSNDLGGPPDSLPAAIDGMKREKVALSGSPAIPELRVTIILCLAAQSLKELERRAINVRRVLEANEFGVPRPFGSQGALCEAMQPGSTTPAVVRDYAQFLLPSDLAGMDPFAGSELGDPQGALLGLNLDDNGSPVLYSVAFGPSAPAPRGPLSGSVGICGKVRGGKSQLTKTLMHDTVEQGGQVITMDRTPMGEYVRLVSVMPGRPQVVEIGPTSSVCLDPMLVFPEEDDAVQYATGFLTLLTSTIPTSVDGLELSQAVRRVRARGGRLVDVAAELASSPHVEGQVLARKLTVLTEGVGLSRVAFGDGEMASLDADYLVFHVPGLQLPSREELTNPVLAAKLLPEQVFSQALLYLITAVMCDVAFRDRSRFTLVGVDEGYILSASPQGEVLLSRVGKDGPKHNSGIAFATHMPSEIPAALSDVFGTKFLFRMASASAATRGLEWLGLQPTKAAIGSILEENRQPGQCLMVDRFGRAGLIQVLEPRDPERRRAYDTGLSQVSVARGTSRTSRPKAGVVS